MAGFPGDPTSHVSMSELAERVKEDYDIETPDRSGYGTRERDYQDHGDFSMGDDRTMKVFGELMDAPEDRLEPGREGAKVADGGEPKPEYGDETGQYETEEVEKQTMKDVNHSRSDAPDSTI